MAANQLTVKAWKGATADLPAATVVENGRLAFYVDTSASTHVVKVCRKVAGTPTWDTVALASEMIPAAVLTTTGDFLVQGASGPERFEVGGAAGLILRSAGPGQLPLWVDLGKQSPAADRPTATGGYAGVVYYATDTQVASLGMRTGESTYGWHTLATALYGLAGARPTAGAEYATCVYYATDLTAASACVRTGASTYAWVALGGGASLAAANTFAAAQSITVTDSVVDESSDALTLGHDAVSSSNGIGVGLRFQARNSTGSLDDVARVAARFSNHSGAGPSSYLSFLLRNGPTGLEEKARLSATGALALDAGLGLHGVTPPAQGAHLPDLDLTDGTDLDGSDTVGKAALLTRMAALEARVNALTVRLRLLGDLASS